MWDFEYKQIVSIYSIYKSFIGYSHFKVKRLVEFYELLFHGIIYNFICIQQVLVTHHEFVWILTLLLLLSSLLTV